MQILTFEQPSKNKPPQSFFMDELAASQDEATSHIYHDVSDIGQARVLLTNAARMIQTQEQRIRQLENMALTDELTGVFNRRGLLQVLQRELIAARRDAQARGILVMMDLDGFKSINDRYGHAAGDDYLRAVGEALMSEVRANDIVARLGGDEFAILLTRIDESAGIDRVNRLEQAFNNRLAIWNRKPIPLRGSFGFAAYSGNDGPETLMAAADLKLYAHKAHRAAAAKKEATTAPSLRG